jgi:hypothetical protein
MINYDPVEELKEAWRGLKACRRFPHQGWEKWCKQPKQIFQKWMLNEMGVFMLLARGDPFNPAESWEKDLTSGRGSRLRICTVQEADN